MGLGRRRSERQEQFWIAAESIGSGPRHAFYDHLNKVLDSVQFDREIEDACEPYYAKRGRRSIPPGVFFRMLFIGYFEGIDSQRGIAWRCEDKLDEIIHRFRRRVAERVPESASRFYPLF